MRFIDLLVNARGQSLIQSIVAIAVSAIAINAVIATTVNMQKANKQLAQKLESIDLKNQLMSTFLKPANCTCQLNANVNVTNASNLKFDSGETSPSINLTELKAGCAPSSPSLTKAGELLPGTQTNLKVKSVKLSEIVATGNPDEYAGFFNIEFDEKTTAGPLASIRIRQAFVIDPASPPGQRTILRCQNDDAGILVASGANVVGTNANGNVTIDLATYGFDPLGSNPHIIVSERDYNYDAVDGNTMDASYCGFVRDSKLVFTVTCWASTNSSNANFRSSFDWMAIQK